MTAAGLRFMDGPWPAIGHLAAPLRVAVFVDEQGVPPALEWDDADADCWHWVVTDPCGEPIATARLRADGHVGRMAVAAGWRRRGVGSALMERIAADARAQGHGQLLLAAQLHALPFYERLGFEAYGEPFPDAGIEHRMMWRRLSE